MSAGSIASRPKIACKVEVGIHGYDEATIKSVVVGFARSNNIGSVMLCRDYPWLYFAFDRGRRLDEFEYAGLENALGEPFRQVGVVGRDYHWTLIYSNESDWS